MLQKLAAEGRLFKQLAIAFRLQMASDGDGEDADCQGADGEDVPAEGDQIAATAEVAEVGVQLGCSISAISEKSSTNMPILIEAIQFASICPLLPEAL
ncbi:hypothetical protein [Thiorhodovibrio frisius]|uniref:Uncharacterized protein n=1 Tax=Thiorhodovibrio frisius TaxID=631362 RepID=H8Z268_9GAMM|nr:hypothetical protein [Thiorhodovibrio frisius]EIC22630.1 hypothetical protein Thi970DRAFT_02908 [Thiorhodovibrio frisius]WPL22386.1 hypothetical protein Thiofri_02550 [Thiorhodovibrio frisius]